MNKFAKIAASLAALLIVAGCGGGGKDAGACLYGTACSGASSTTASAAVARVTVELSSTKMDNGDDAAFVNATVTAVDSSNKTLSGIPVSISVDGAVFTASDVTDANGKVVAKITRGADKSNRSVTVSAKSGSLSDAKSFSVVGTKILATPTNVLVSPSTAGSVTFTLKDSSNGVLAFQPIEVEGTAGLPPVKGTTDPNGEFVYSFTAPATNGTVTITASSLGVVASQDIQVQSTSTVIPSVTSPITASIEVNPSVVSVNAAGSSANKALVRVFFKDSTTNKALPNVRVKFDLADGAESVGGTFTAPDTYSDATGYATTSYVPGALASPTGGLTIRACYASTGASAAACTTAGSRSTSKAITVKASSVSVTLGTDDKIGVDVPLMYYKRWVVQVVDAAGFPMPNVEVTPQVDPIRYAKGYYTAGATTWTLAGGFECSTEDANGNSFLDTDEDKNFNGTIEPRRADIAIDYEDSTLGRKTDAGGRIILRVYYPQSVASWATVKLSVTAQVDGSEGRAVKVFELPVLASALQNVSVSPAFMDSPYGLAFANVVVPAGGRVMPDGTPKAAGTTLTPCENPD
jgi:hypothetical protein